MLKAFLFLVATCASMTFAQNADAPAPGQRDPSFNPNFKQLLFTLAEQPDGKILLGFGYSSEGAQVMRLNSDGTQDESFALTTLPALAPFNSFISQIEVLPDGKIYVAGNFNSTSGSWTFGVNGLARLNPNGTLDTNFNPHLSPLKDYETIVFDVQPDGNLIVAISGSGITDVHHQEQQAMSGNTLPIRIRPDGSLDKSFIYLPTTHLIARQIEVQDDGSVLVAGSLNFENTGIHRFQATGGAPETLVTVDGGIVYQMEVKDNHLLIAGSFTNVNGLAAANLARIRISDWSLDESLNASVNGDIHQIAVREEIYIAGKFTTVDGAARPILARLNADGSLDSAFQIPAGFEERLTELHVQRDGKLLVAGPFEEIGGVPSRRLVRLVTEANPGKIQFAENRILVSESETAVRIEIDRIDGSQGPLSATVQTVDGAANAGTDYDAILSTVTYGDNEYGRRIVEIPLRRNPAQTGNQTFTVRLTTQTGTAEATVLIVDEDGGTMDPTFQIDARLNGTNGVIRDFEIAPDGSVILAGEFTSVNGFAMTNLARLNPDLTVDETFIPEAFPNAPVDSVAVRPNGQIILAGAFTKIGDSITVKYIAQLNPSLAYDREFIMAGLTSGALQNPARQVHLQADGKILVGGTGFIRRLNENGSRDMTYMHQSTTAFDLLPMPDGTIRRASNGGLDLLSTNGNLQSSISTRYRTNQFTLSPVPVHSLAIEESGSVLFGGEFNELAKSGSPAYPAERLARLSPSGVVDTNFAPRIGTNSVVSGGARNVVSAIQPLPGGDALVGGNFQVVDGAPHTLIARISPDGRARQSFQPVLEGEQVDEILLLANGSVLVRGAVTNVSGNPVNGLLKLDLGPGNQAPIIQIHSPLPGTVLELSDAIPAISIDIQAFDPDGFLKDLRVEIDGAPLAKDENGNLTKMAWIEELGEHQITAIAEDEFGLLATNIVTFEVVQGTLSPEPVTVRRDGNELFILYSPHQTLQASEDLEEWIDAAEPAPAESGLLEYPIQIPNSTRYRFFRAVNK